MESTSLTHHGIMGMKWGVRRYQNKDGSLTAAGEKRYNKDIRDNLAKKKDSRIDTSNPDPKRWVKEDMTRSKRVVDAGSDLIRQVKKISQETQPKPTKSKLDLSKMSDKEMRDKINRELLEKQYNQLFAPEIKPEISKGKQYVDKVLEIGCGTLAVASSALNIALAIKELRR